MGVERDLCETGGCEHIEPLFEMVGAYSEEKSVCRDCYLKMVSLSPNHWLLLSHPWFPSRDIKIS